MKKKELGMKRNVEFKWFWVVKWGWIMSYCNFLFNDESLILEGATFTEPLKQKLEFPSETDI